jgi:hypothetical protein
MGDGHAIADHRFSNSVAGFDPARVDVCANCVWRPRCLLKARESADAPNDQKVTLYQKSKAVVIGMDHYKAS